MIQVIMRIFAPRLVADPLAIRMHVRRIRVARLIAEIRMTFGVRIPMRSFMHRLRTVRRNGWRPVAAMLIVIVLRHCRNRQKQAGAYQADCLLHLTNKACSSATLLRNSKYRRLQSCPVQS